MVDETLVGKTRKRYKYASFYTNSDPIVGYMTALLQPESGDYILEPCAGEGAFIDNLLELPIASKLSIDALDLNPKAIKSLNEKFSNHKNIRVIETDTLLDDFAQADGLYDKVIGNPPYGAYQTQERRTLLKNIYGGYVKETYTLFISKCLSSVKDGGRLVFIVPDTFLTLNMQRSFRKELLLNNVIESIAVFPSKFFPGVSFGYSKLCIISIRRGYQSNNLIRFVRLSKSVKDLPKLLLDNSVDSYVDEDSLLEQDLIIKDEHLTILPKPKTTISAGRKGVALGEIARCVTGFYSGDNERFLKVIKARTAKDKKHGEIPQSSIYQGMSDRDSLIHGVKSKASYIPILKGGRSNFKNDTNWLVEWSTESVRHYHSDSRARFQNSSFYFTQGIGIPMVRSKSSTSAFLLDNRLFDQSVVGIFPHDKSLTLYLLGLLNSKTYLDLMAEINHTANNSANYVKRIPVIIDNERKTLIEENINNYLSGNSELADTMTLNDRYFAEIYTTT